MNIEPTTVIVGPRRCGATTAIVDRLHELANQREGRALLVVNNSTQSRDVQHTYCKARGIDNVNVIPFHSLTPETVRGYVAHGADLFGDPFSSIAGRAPHEQVVNHWDAITVLVPIDAATPASFVQPNPFVTGAAEVTA